MLKKILAMCLAIFMLTTASGISAFARTIGGEGEQAAAKNEKQIEKKDLKNSFKTESGAANDPGKTNYSRAEYERQKAQGKKFSTTTKILIGVGVAAAALGIFVFAASRDKIRTF